MRVLVCGGRDFHHWCAVDKALRDYHRAHEITLIIEGGATGADRLARTWAQLNGIKFETFEADWNKYGHSAGPRRNHQMLEQGKPNVVIAFKGGKGTENMKSLARKAKIEVIDFG